MIEKVLNTGIRPTNSESLNRKIRISNLIALLAVVLIGLYTPLYVYYAEYPGMCMNLSFWGISLFTFYLNRRHYYIPGFFLYCTAGYLYFIFGTLIYGTVTNLHFFMLVMCMIVTTLFDNAKVIRFYTGFAVAAFFGLLWWSAYFEPLVTASAEMKPLELITGNVNLLLLFFITSVFILFFKREMLRSQQRVLEQKAVIEDRNRDITDSIHYAKRIQTALLPGRQTLLKLFPGAFLYFRPKDIVSGDFYWLHSSGDYTFVAVGDCTGHGVPGALMSVLGINLLTEIVENKQINEPARILDELRSGIINAFDKEGRSSEYKDGMDISILRIREREQSFCYAAANNPVYRISADGLEELPATKQPVGYAHTMTPFVQHEGTYHPGDTFVLFTDGFADQFGGPRNKKFLYRSFRETLVQGLAGDTEQFLHDAFESWRGASEQVDDVCVVGIRL
jgi:phosphoserine phosphatase RsbU/P